MQQEQKDILARVLDMTETELRATLITIVKDVYDKGWGPTFGPSIKQSVDAAYNPIRRTGVKI